MRVVDAQFKHVKDGHVAMCGHCGQSLWLITDNTLDSRHVGGWRNDDGAWRPTARHLELIDRARAKLQDAERYTTAERELARQQLKVSHGFFPDKAPAATPHPDLALPAFVHCPRCAGTLNRIQRIPGW